MPKPSLYKEEYIARAEEFFSDAEWDDEKKMWLFPSRVRFARMIGVTMQTVQNWEKEFPEFGAVMANGIENSKELRVAFAENEKINPVFAKYVLSSAYGMRERSAVDIGNDEGKPFEVNIRIVES